MRRLGYLAIALFLLVLVGAGLIGRAIGPGVLRPTRLNPERRKCSRRARTIDRSSSHGLLGLTLHLPLGMLFPISWLA